MYKSTTRTTRTSRQTMVYESFRRVRTVCSALELSLDMPISKVLI